MVPVQMTGKKNLLLQLFEHRTVSSCVENPVFCQV